MNFKRFHESKNLFDKDNADYYNAYINESGYWALAETSRSVRFPCLPNTQYTLKINYTGYDSLFRLCESSDETVAPYSTSAGPRLNIIIRTTNIAEYTFTTSATAKVLVFQGAPSPNENTWIDTLMLNTGSQPLPYEPYSSEVWHDTPHYIHNTSTDTLTTLPAVLYPNDTTATVGLKGDMSQTGTPSPDNPIQPQETGERTGNLIGIEDCTITFGNMTVTAKDNSITFSGTFAGEVYGNNAKWGALSFTLPAGTYYMHSFVRPSPFIFTGFLRYVMNDNGDKICDSGQNVFTLESETKCHLAFYLYNKTDGEFVYNTMLNEGSTALPYEPYGYKIPILNNSQTTNVYLGEVQTTRKIKKLVLDGTEAWYTSSNTGVYYTTKSASLNPTYSSSICNRFVYHFVNSVANLAHGEYLIDMINRYTWLRNNDITSLQDWKAWLAQQYAAGTPVTVWYVLATPETAVVNEPLRKIGTYADEVSGITIPVTAGANTISVGTTLQPSEVTATYKGWHPVSAVHERENGAWD